MQITEFEFKLKPRQFLCSNVNNCYSDIYEQNGRKWKLGFCKIQADEITSTGGLLLAPINRSVGLQLINVDAQSPKTFTVTFMIKSLKAQTFGWQYGPHTAKFDKYNGCGTDKSFTLAELHNLGCYDYYNDTLTIGVHIELNNAPTSWIATSPAVP